MASKTSATRIIAQQRKIRVLELRQQDYTQLEIANTVGITEGRVSQILKECLAEMDQEAIASAADYRKHLTKKLEKQAQRLIQMLASPLLNVEQRLKAEEQLRKNTESIAKLTGAVSPAAVLIPVSAQTQPVLTTEEIQRVIRAADAWVPPIEPSKESAGIECPALPQVSEMQPQI